MWHRGKSHAFLSRPMFYVIINLLVEQFRTSDSDGLRYLHTLPSNNTLSYEVYDARSSHGARMGRTHPIFSGKPVGKLTLGIRRMKL
jgi:hypothetical protein